MVNEDFFKNYSAKPGNTGVLTEDETLEEDKY
jgi:hypothetical protein